eukprot:CAMPEP_0204363888 /NCGR_PEP_ID=MMETSP0469-20131031/40700_1 /ASSEMBLY_ACC=CAM_ASM_000384 /TAXON_ID=2969 /ORGANISM="Oxyrrhis marina" /LENGTH=94 /DNA_ID=CAMNT_0051352689 /DNA_START=117 /DNA_END=401 /DNA_ORIENTATION=+
MRYCSSATMLAIVPRTAWSTRRSTSCSSSSLSLATLGSDAKYSCNSGLTASRTAMAAEAAMESRTRPSSVSAASRSFRPVRFMERSLLRSRRAS